MTGHDSIKNREPYKNIGKPPIPMKSTPIRLIICKILTETRNNKIDSYVFCENSISSFQNVMSNLKDSSQKI